MEPNLSSRKMQAYRTATKVDADHDLHIPQVPFQPGAEVEVIVLGISSPANPVATARPSDDSRRGAARLVEEQYRLARQHPGEYVVLVGEQIVSHSPDRQEAFRAYDQAFLDFPGRDPVIAEPDGGPKRPPVVRGRSLTRSLRGRR